MSEIKVNKISPKQTCTQLTLGDSGDTIIIPAGATITNNGTATGFGRTGTVNWDTTPKTTTVTAVSGVGYFVDTTTTTLTVNLPVGSAGSIVAVSDYANTASTNNISITPNGTDKINGGNFTYTISTNGAAITLVYVDATRGWKDINDATLDATGLSSFVVATGGTILTCGDYKTHVFTGPGTFTVTSAGTPVGSNSVEYLVVAGGGSGAGGYPSGGNPGGGGAGGYRQNYPSPATAGLPVTVQAYPITVGGGGATAPTSLTPSRNSGSPSIFSTITSAGGGGGGTPCTVAPTKNGESGGSGGGGGYAASSGGTGNTPPTSPPQGNNGGAGIPFGGPPYGAGGGGGAGGVGSGHVPAGSGPGGVGSPIATTVFGPTSPSYGTPGPAPGRYFAGGGGGGSISPLGVVGGTGGAGGGATGGSCVAATTNTGGGGGGSSLASSGTAGGSGIVVIRYKFQ
jgi:hypothetical protein